MAAPSYGGPEPFQTCSEICMISVICHSVYSPYLISHDILRWYSA